MFGYCAARGRRTMVGIAIFNCFYIPLYYYYIVKRHYNQYENFLATVDPYKMLEYMCDRDAMQSCPRNLAKLREEKSSTVKALGLLSGTEAVFRTDEQV
uniref:Uncharacterized protein n=1 Tax=Romanomermis culicivorax TaxID=13658 RepID=A0A915K908_ROMCU